MQEYPLVVRKADAPQVRMSGDRGESIRLVDERFEYDRLNARLQRLETDEAGRTHRHPGSDLLCYVVSGELELTTPAGVDVLASGDVVVIPAGMDHAIRKAGGEALTFLEVYAPGRPEFEYA
ncbi:MAG TPA: cupin domain-containing protein [Candidatus Limnocylindria bacterium]|nr:cupin domain-containing protein [Candidatus Limnocylindria bacterium]